MVSLFNEIGHSPLMLISFVLLLLRADGLDGGDSLFDLPCTRKVTQNFCYYCSARDSIKLAALT